MPTGVPPWEHAAILSGFVVRRWGGLLELGFAREVGANLTVLLVNNLSSAIHISQVGMLLSPIRVKDSCGRLLNSSEFEMERWAEHRAFDPDVEGFLRRLRFRSSIVLEHELGRSDGEVTDRFF